MNEKLTKHTKLVKSIVFPRTEGTGIQQAICDHGLGGLELFVSLYNGDTEKYHEVNYDEDSQVDQNNIKEVRMRVEHAYFIIEIYEEV